MTGFLKLCLHTHTHAYAGSFQNYLQSPCIFISVSFWWVFSKRGYQQRVCLEWNSIRRQLRNSRLIEVNGFRIMPSIGKRIINTTKKQNKRNKSNEKLQRCRLLNFLFKHFLKNKKSRNVQQDSMNSFLELAIKQPRAGRALNRYKFLLFFNCTLFSQTVWWREIIVCVVKGKERRKNKNPFLVLTTPIQFSRTWRERSGPF